jgi:hypothetical protein
MQRADNTSKADAFETYVHSWERMPGKASELASIRRMHEAGWNDGLADAASMLKELVDEGTHREDVSGLSFDWRAEVRALVKKLEEDSGVAAERRAGAEA